jgi:methylated-DNA-[protein]-cysteine S-methyltransferase
VTAGQLLQRRRTPFFADAFDGYQAKLDAGFAVLGVRTEGDFLTSIEYLPQQEAALPPQNRFVEEVCAQLGAYLAEPTFRFDLPLKLKGTPYQREVWRVIGSIRCGGTLTYQEVASRLYSAPRAVGQACGANLIPIIIPCHRVVAKRGLGGFMHGRDEARLSIKRWLLTHEARR